MAGGLKGLAAASAAGALLTGLLSVPGCLAMKARGDALAGQLGEARQLLDRTARDLGTCQGNTRRLSADIAAQNAAIEQWAADALTRRQAAQRAVDAAQARAASAEARAARILAEGRAISAAGDGGPAACADVDRLILETVSEGRAR